jgi:hypothetical protein
MNTALLAVDEEGNTAKISVDVSLYEIEEMGDGTCLLVHKHDPDRWYEVISSFNYLHILSNGFNSNILN